MADPFVYHHAGYYYAVGTGGRPTTETQFPLLRSTDLIHWDNLGGALIPVPDMVEYWAAEVAFHDGLFYLYYSARAASGRDHHLRVATSADPAGPFTDIGRDLVPDQPFSIDAHPFRDQNGDWYLFYSRDFLTRDEGYHVGTGIVVDRLTDMLTLAGDPKLVVRPHAAWQLFRAQRAMYGDTYDWYTVEGAAVRVHNGRIYCFYSGGAWEHDNYGIAYVTADHPLGPYHPPKDAEVDLPILRSDPPHMIGPGHNSFITTPDGAEYAVYHAWDAGMTARRMCLDRLHWDGDRPVIHGPTSTPQPAPIHHWIA
jgi:GH43 family beta-xylosidase